MRRRTIFNMAVGILLHLAILTRSQLFACYSESNSQISSKSGGVMMSYTMSRWRLQRLHTTSGFVFNVVALFRSSKIYLQNKFHRHISFTAITTSGLEKQTFAILEFFFRLLLQPYHSNWRAILHRTAKSSNSWRNNDVIYNFKMAAASALCYFRFCI